MPTLLHIDSSPLSTSVSRELTAEFVKSWKTSHADGKVIERDLSKTDLKAVDQTWIYAAHTPEDSRTSEQKAALALSDQLIAELVEADEYVIGVAMHNFSIPSVLKLWIDQIARAGKTFAYGEYGPVGLLENKKATVLVATGGNYESGSPAASMNFVEPYVKTVLSFIGVKEITFVTAGGTAALMSGKVDRGEFLAPTISHIRELVA